MFDLWMSYTTYYRRHLKLFKKVLSAFDGSGASCQGSGFLFLRGVGIEISELFVTCLAFAFEVEAEGVTCSLSTRLRS